MRRAQNSCEHGGVAYSTEQKPTPSPTHPYRPPGGAPTPSALTNWAKKGSILQPACIKRVAWFCTKYDHAFVSSRVYVAW
jgi:hypothetical protein